MNLSTLLIAITLAILISLPTFAIASPLFVKNNTYSYLPVRSLKILLIFLLASSTLIYAYIGDLCEVEHWLEFLRLNPGVHSASYSFLLSFLDQIFFQNLFLLSCICGILIIVVLIHFLGQCTAVECSTFQYSFASFLLLLFLNRYSLQFFSVPRTIISLAIASISLVLFFSARTKSFLSYSFLSDLFLFLSSCFFAFLALSFHPTSILLIFPLFLCLLRDITSLPLKYLYSLGIIVAFTFVFLGESLLGSYNEEIIFNWTLSSSIWVPVNFSISLLFCYCARKLYYLSSKYIGLSQNSYFQYLLIFGIVYSPFSIVSSLINFERVNIFWPAYICLCLFILRRYSFASSSVVFLYVCISLIGSTMLSFEISGKLLVYDSFPSASIQLACSNPIWHESFLSSPIQYFKSILDAVSNLVPLAK